MRILLLRITAAMAETSHNACQENAHQYPSQLLTVARLTMTTTKWPDRTSTHVWKGRQEKKYISRADFRSNRHQAFARHTIYRPDCFLHQDEL
jgi:hypothetical protein